MPCIVVRPPAGFAPSGMTKNGSQALNSSYATITSWIADTTNYPGSTVSSNGVVAQGTKTATLTANIPYTGGFSQTTTVRIQVNGTTVVTGSGNGADNGTATATTNTPITAGDVVTVQGTSSGVGTTTVSSGTSTYVRIT